MTLPEFITLLQDPMFYMFLGFCLCAVAMGATTIPNAQKLVFTSFGMGISLFTIGILITVDYNKLWQAIIHFDVELIIYLALLMFFVASLAKSLIPRNSIRNIIRKFKTKSTQI